MTDKFLKNMQRLFESGSAGISLKMILEEEEKEEKEEKEDPFADAFSDEGEDDESDEEEVSDNEETEETESSEETSSDGDVYTSLSDLTRFTKTIHDAKHAKDVVKDRYSFNIDKNITGKVVADSFVRKVQVRDFLLLEKDKESETTLTLDKVEKTLEDEQERIENLSDKAHYVNAEIISGEKINIDDQANNALSDFEKFDRLFSKEEIVANIYIKQIVDLSSPEDAESNVKAFLDTFNDVLPDDKKLSIQTDATSYNAMAGAKPTA